MEEIATAITTVIPLASPSERFGEIGGHFDAEELGTVRGMGRPDAVLEPLAGDHDRCLDLQGDGGMPEGAMVTVGGKEGDEALVGGSEGGGLLHVRRASCVRHRQVVTHPIDQSHVANIKDGHALPACCRRFF